jgi:hypothetical protein
MDNLGRWWVLAVAVGLLAAACGRAVPGTPSAMAASAVESPAAAGAAGTEPRTTGLRTASPSPPTLSGEPPASATRARSSTLESDVLADECLLDAAGFGALLDRPVRAEQSVVRRGDGTRSTSCYATAVDGPRAPLAAINVYRVRSGTPAEFVRAAGGRPLGGAGEAATLLETAVGPTLQVAAPAFLVTVLVQGRSPPDETWRAAARAALARLPS